MEQTGQSVLTAPAAHFSEQEQAACSTPAASAAAGGTAAATLTATAGPVIPLHEMERIMILKGLEVTAGNRTQAAELLGISVRTLRNKLNEYRAAGHPVE